MPLADVAAGLADVAAGQVDVAVGPVDEVVDQVGVVAGVAGVEAAGVVVAGVAEAVVGQMGCLAVQELVAALAGAEWEGDEQAARYGQGLQREGHCL